MSKCRCRAFHEGEGTGIVNRSIYINILFGKISLTSLSKVYGQTLLLCRVLVGCPYQGAEHRIPAPYNSKLVRPDTDGKAQMIIVDKEDQILPAFQIVVNWN